MRTYYLTILGVFLLSFMAESFARPSRLNEDGTRTKMTFGTKVSLFLCAFLLIFVAGCRYYVGSDFGAYYRGITVYGSKLKESIRNFDEPGLPLIGAILGYFTDDGAYFIFICSLLTVGLFLLTIYKNSEGYIFASLLFVLVGTWDGTFNGVRQYLASAILFCGHRAIYDKKIWKWLLTVFLATCVHSTALVMVVLYFLLRNKVNAWHIILLALGTYIVSANYDRIFSLIGLVKTGDGATSYASRSVNILRILVACAPAVLALVIYFKRELTAEQTFYINALVIHAAAMVAASNSAYLARIGIYTSPFVSVALPKLLRLKNGVLEKILRVGVVFLYFIFWYKDISGNPEMNQFQWVFSRKLG
ncbi:MAG: EpsG family protein [Clostridia bacterium]|nr:EpsG family protein [Clostridia bacterium]